MKLTNLALASGVLLAAVAVQGCKKDAPAASAPQAAVAVTAPVVKPAEALPAATTATDAAEPAAAAPDPLRNVWSLPARGTSAKDGSRVFVLTQGKDRTYDSATAVYRLFAYDLGEAKGDVLTIQELGGGSFKVTGLFVIPAGVDTATNVKPGDMVLAEWAGELKHAIVTKIDTDKVSVRYTNLPDSWPEDRVTAIKDLREVTKQTEGLNPGNFAVAQEEGRAHQVLLIAQSGDKWVTRRFAGRVGIFESKDLTPISLKPALKVGQAVQAPWVGMMYPGKVKKITGTRVEVAVDGIATKEPVVTSLGQVLPEPAGAKADAKKDEAKPAVKGKPAK
ncbi:MAG: hypothetical protein ACOYOB_16690 [Myxococcota bacterium]